MKEYTNGRGSEVVMEASGARGQTLREVNGYDKEYYFLRPDEIPKGLLFEVDLSALP